MATNDTTPKSSIAPDPTTVYCGRDAAGSYHHWQRGRGLILVVAPDGTHVEWRQDLGTASVYDWLDHIGETRGWERRRLHETMADALTAQLE